MKQLNKNQLIIIKGGVTGAMINSIARVIGTLLELGRSLGSGIRRIVSRNICPI